MPVNPADPNTVPKFVDPLPRPGVFQPVGEVDGQPLYEVRMLQVEQQLHRDFPLTTVWGYNGSYPGPSFDVRRDQPILVWYLNKLPTMHLLTVDHSIHGAEPFRPDVRNVVHVHGLNVPPEFDGHPEAWFTPGLPEAGPEFITNLYAYPNRQPAANLWYHDHALGITRLNVYAGLAGFYLIRDDAEERLRLPAGEFEIPMVIQDRTFTETAALSYPPTIVPEFFGNTMLVNGKVWPFLEVEPRRYRIRLINGCNARFLRLRFDPALPIVQIGAEVGLFRRKVVLDELLMGPGERADLILDFTDRFCQTLTLTNNAPTPFPGGVAPDANTSVIMQFRVVKPLSGKDRSRIPVRLVNEPALKPAQAIRVRDLTLNEVTDDMGRIEPLLGTRSISGRPLPLTWGDATTELPELGTAEIWRLINVTMDTHPIHLHLVRFQVLDRRPFDVGVLMSTGELAFTGPPQKPAPNERGFKDTVRAEPGMVTRIIARFGDFCGEYVWHGHILEHEDHDMMRRYNVLCRCDYSDSTGAE